MTSARAGAVAVLIGTLLSLSGLAWDIQWHVEVGPDTFFTAAHLLLYSGSAVAGLASLVMVLLGAAAQRAGRPWPRAAGGPPVRLLGGASTAPLGYLLSGGGAALFLLYGLLDLWWHSIYGIDAVLTTPSHVALFLSVTVTMAGVLVVFAAAREQGWARIGLLPAVGVLIAFAPMTFNGLAALPLPFDPERLGTLFCAPLLLIMGSMLLGTGAAVRIAVVLAVLQAALWWFTPWATRAYAEASGLPIRDGLADRPPQLPFAIPMFLIAAAVAVELLAGRVHAGRLRPRGLVILAGPCTGLAVAAGLAAQLALLGGRTRVAEVVALCAAGLLLGPLAAFLGSRLAVLLRVSGEIR